MPDDLERFLPHLSGRIAYEHLHRYALATRFATGRRILDVAAGEGYGAAMLSEVAASVVGLEIDSPTVESAQQRYAGRLNLEFTQGDGAAMPFGDAEFDIVVSFETLEHMADATTFLDEVRRVLRPGGHFLCSTPNRPIYAAENVKPNPFHVHELDETEFEAVLRNLFENVRLLGQRFVIGSLIADLTPESGAYRALTLARDDMWSRAIDRTVAAKPAKYLLAVCSDVPSIEDASEACIYVDATDDLWLETERVLKWASTLHGEDEQLRSAVANGEAQLNAARAELEEERSHNKVLSDFVERTRVMRAAFSEEASSLGAALAASAQARSASEEALARSETRLRAALEDAYGAWALVRTQRLELAESLQRLTDEQGRNQALSAERDDLGAKVEKLRARAVEDTDRLAEAARIDEARAAQLAEAMRDSAALGTELRELRSRIEADALRNTALVNAAAAARAEHAGRLSEASRALNDRNARLAEAEREIAELRGEREELWLRAAANAALIEEFQAAVSRLAEAERAEPAGASEPPIMWPENFATEAAAPSRPWLPSELADYWLPQRLRDYAMRRLSDDEVGRLEYLMGIVARFEADQFGFVDSATGRELISTMKDEARIRATDAPVVSIVVPVFDNIVYTLTCLASVLLDASSPALEFLVGDDRSKDATATVLGAVGGCVQVVTHERQLGFLENCNSTARHARGRYLVLLNNDTIALPGWLAALTDLLDVTPDAGLVGSKLLNADGTLQEAGGIFWQDGSAWNFGRGSDGHRPEFNYLREADYISGAAIALPLAVWRQLGGFDRTYTPAYCEDSDLAFRVRAAGLRVLYQPLSEIVHHEGRSHGRDLATGIKAYQVVNSRKLQARWGRLLAREHFPNGRDLFVARDRSRKRPHLLVIDHYVPQPDRDAGSRTIDAYISMFVERGFQVSFWPENLHEDVPYVRALQRRGVEVLYGLDYVDHFTEWLAQAAPWLDAVLVSRPHIALRFLPTVRDLFHGPILYYGHDLHWRRLEAEHALTGDPAKAEASRMAREEERAVFSHVDVVMYPAAEEVEFARADAPTGRAILEVPAYLFSEATLRQGEDAVAEVRHAQSRDLLFVGGFGHSPNVDAVQWFVSEVVPLLRQREIAVRLRIVGSKTGPAIRALAAPDVEVMGEVSDALLDELYRGAAAVIAPLRYGAGVKGKVIEAFSKGRPVISSSVGVQGIVGAETFALVADTPEAFTDAVAESLADRAAASARAHRAIGFLRSRYTSSSMAEVLSPYVPRLADGEPASMSAYAV